MHNAENVLTLTQTIVSRNGYDNVERIIVGGKYVEKYNSKILIVDQKDVEHVIGRKCSRCPHEPSSVPYWDILSFSVKIVDELMTFPRSI